MIKIIHIGSIVLCILSTILFVFSGFYLNKNADAYGPEIHMEETEIEVSIHATEEELLQGITATDKKDGDVTDSLLVESMGLFINTGKRNIIIDAFDNNHNVTKIERTIQYTDYISPRIKISNPLRVPLNDINQLMDCITVEDCLDGDITDALQITPMNNVTSFALPGEYEMKLTVSNSVGDVVELPVVVELYDNLSDSSKPKALLSDYLIYKKVGESIEPQDYLIGFVQRGVTYEWDALASGLAVPYVRKDVSIKNNVDTAVPGVYEILYSMTDAGYATNVRQVVIVEE